MNEADGFFQLDTVDVHCARAPSALDQDVTAEAQYLHLCATAGMLLLQLENVPDCKPWNIHRFILSVGFALSLANVLDRAAAREKRKSGNQ